MKDIVVLTPTFNRQSMLSKLYDSLKLQRDKNFNWLIIDDGSTDNTASLVQYMIEENLIDITYIYQSNGGKGRALNNGFSIYKSVSAYIVVDSDDYLLPTGIENVRLYLNKYGDRNEIGAFFFHYKTPDGQVLKPKGKLIDKDYILNPYEYNSRFGKNDGCICYLSNAVSKYKYPEFQGENYIGPTILQLEMSDKYQIVYSPIIIGVAEYQTDGLTMKGRKLRLKNPMGMIHYSKLMMSKKTQLITQIKYAISIWPYAKKANLSFKDLVNYTERPYLLALTFFPGKFLAMIWDRRTIDDK